MPHKAALVILETDGCFADGVEVASGAVVGHRTLRIVDQGKIAATFANVESGQTVRLAPVWMCASALWICPGDKKKYYAQLKGYQIMPETELFTFQEVKLEPALKLIISRPGLKAKCANCGEEIINERQVCAEGKVLCRTCAGRRYYNSLEITL